MAENKIKSINREIQILKIINHPHIIYLEKVYESPKKIYLVLEVCSEVLANVFKKKKPFSEYTTRKVIEELANAVAYLHRNGKL